MSEDLSTAEGQLAALEPYLELIASVLLTGRLTGKRRLVVRMSRDRMRAGFSEYGSALFDMPDERLWTEFLQEMADGVVYAAEIRRRKASGLWGQK